MENTVQNQNSSNLMPQRLQGKVALITGGNSGIGLAAAELFIQHGAFEYITGSRQEQLDEAVARLDEQATAVRGDISDMQDLGQLIAA